MLHNDGSGTNYTKGLSEEDKEDMKRFGPSWEDAEPRRNGEGKLRGHRLTQVHLEHDR